MAERPSSVLDKGLFAIAGPIYLERLFGTFIGFVDVLISSLISDAAAAAVGTINSVLVFLFIASTLAHGGVIVCAQFIGARRDQELPQIHASILLACGALSALMSVVLSFFPGSLELILGRLPETVRPQAEVYTRVVGGALLLHSMASVGSSIVASHGHTKQSAVASILASIVNTAVSAGFVLIADMGVLGIALGTVIAQVVHLVLIIFAMRALKIRVAWRCKFRRRLEHWTVLMKVSTPFIFDYIIYYASLAVTIRMLTHMGKVALASRAYVETIMSLFEIAGFAFNGAVTIIIGQLTGGKLFDRARQQLSTAARAGVLIAVCAISVLILLRHTSMRLFSDDSAVIETGATMLLIAALFSPAKILNNIYGGGLRAAGDVRYSTLVNLIATWMIYIPTAYFLGIYLDYGIAGVWLALGVNEALQLALLVARWSTGRWQTMSLA